MQIQMKLRLETNNTIKRVIKTVVIKLLKESFIEVNGFFTDRNLAILDVTLPSVENVSELLLVVCNRTTDYIKNMYLIENVKIANEDITLKMVS